VKRDRQRPCRPWRPKFRVPGTEKSGPCGIGATSECQARCGHRHLRRPVVRRSCDGSGQCRRRAATPSRDPISAQDGREPETRNIEDAGRRGAEQRTKKCTFHGERENMREPALIVVTLGACLDGPRTRTCRGFLWRVQEAAERLALMRLMRLMWLMRLSQQMQRWPKEHQFSRFVQSATQYTTLSGRSGPEPMVGTDSLHPGGVPRPCQNGRKPRSPAVTHGQPEGRTTCERAATPKAVPSGMWSPISSVHGTGRPTT
jgi:hypothetical protein